MATRRPLQSERQRTFFHLKIIAAACLGRAARSSPSADMRRRCAVATGRRRAWRPPRLCPRSSAAADRRRKRPAPRIAGAAAPKKVAAAANRPVLWRAASPIFGLSRSARSKSSPPRPTIRARTEYFVGDCLVALAENDVHHRLGSHELGIGSDHDGMTEFSPHAGRFLQDILQPGLQPHRGELVAQVRDHSSGHLMEILFAVIRGRSSDRQAFTPCNGGEMRRDGLELLGIDGRCVPQRARILDDVEQRRDSTTRPPKAESRCSPI